MKEARRAVVVGSGPNGLSAAARLASKGWQVDVYEAGASAGGAARSSTEVFPGAVVDLGAAAHPFGVASPAFDALDLAAHGLRWCQAPYEMAHPLVGQEAALLSASLERTADGLGVDARAWEQLHGAVVRDIDKHLENFLGPMLRVPPHPTAMLRFGPPAVLPAKFLGENFFRTQQARALFAGSAVHAILSPTKPMTSAFGVLFGALGMTRGWPVARGGSQAIVDALLRVLESHGGRVHVNSLVEDVRELGPADAVVLNLTPRQVGRVDGVEMSVQKRRRMGRWRYGTAVYKADFLLREAVPWADPRVRQASTVHVGGSVAEIARAEAEAAAGRLPEYPFVMVCQQYAADPGRGLVLWSYAHVPHGYVERYPGEVREAIMRAIERFAPGFRDVVVETKMSSPAQLEAWNPNLVGGDIAGGSMAGAQLLLRPGLSARPYRVGSVAGGAGGAGAAGGAGGAAGGAGGAARVYLASASTPPGAGVHGMAGWWAAEQVLADFAAD